MSIAYPEPFYGRRKGKPLSAKQKLLLDHALKDVSLAVPEGGHIDLKKIFGGQSYSEYWFEFGFGGGEHLCEQAEKHPHVGFIGAEAFLNGVVSCMQLIDKKQLSNIRIHSGDGRQVLRRLPNHSLSKMIILFPDPWPKRRHSKRRLVGDTTLKEIARLLVDGGELRLASDHTEYVAWFLDQIKDVPQFVPQFDFSDPPTLKPPGWEPTRYEQKALSAGTPCYYLSFFKKPEPV